MKKALSLFIVFLIVASAYIISNDRRLERKLFSTENFNSALVAFNTPIGEYFTKIQGDIAKSQDGSEEKLRDVQTLFATKEYLETVSKNNDRLFKSVFENEKEVWMSHMKNIKEANHFCEIGIMEKYVVEKNKLAVCVSTSWIQFALNDNNKPILLKYIDEESLKDVKDFLADVSAFWPEKTVDKIFEFYKTTVLDTSKMQEIK